MNHSSEILGYLASREAPERLVLAANAPPVCRTHDGIEVALNNLLSADDVGETLIALRSLAPTVDGSAIRRSGAFSFGVRDVGRFRVNYATQRSSKVVTIARIPFAIPKPSDLCDDDAVLEKLATIVASRERRMLAVSGPNSLLNTLFVYALLQEANESTRQMIYILERGLTFLMGHANSIVIQSEVDTDVTSMEEGIQNGFLFLPDIMYVGGVRSAQEMDAISRVAEAAMLTIADSAAMSSRSMLSHGAPRVRDGDENSTPIVRTALNLQPGRGGKVGASLMDHVVAS